MAALGDPERWQIVLRLLESDATQKQLSAELGLSSATLSRRMNELELMGLVARERSHSPYVLLFRQPVLKVLQAGAELAEAVSTRQATVDQAKTKDLRRLEFLGKADDQLRERDG
ncbi:winged helix-turn-helix domain-containing protein [Solirubrobacter phytolaccae]|uniref:Winged helix-turn-helix domain-containing protein n=1 Tax=Solirubrobacter phytolaccae TaxID=1404360 RepID=A0A9X3N4J1_9ACTN|nr:winged helix-turn-helix domain-containing protein [Solirubrobacter phytolaccae]MDA0179710.1 winged helix-turn-helix domain-containing protein [Solirubrobacter phytolaccae]